MTSTEWNKARKARQAKRAQLSSRRSFTRVYTDNSVPGVAIMTEPQAVTLPPGEGLPKDPAMAKYVEPIDTKVYKCSRLITVIRDRIWKLGPDDKVEVDSLHKLRKAVHEQQPKRMQPKLDAWLEELFERELVATLKKGGNDAELIKLAGYKADLVLFSARDGDRLEEPGLNKLWKVADFPKWPANLEISMADCVDVIPFMSKALEMFENSGMPLVQYVSLIQQFLIQTDATDVSKTAIRDIKKQPELTKDFTDATDYNILIINTLRKTPVDYLYEKWLADLHNTQLNVEVRSERLRRTLYEIQNRYDSIPGREPMHLQLLKVDRYQTLCYYGLQTDTDKIIRGQANEDGTGGHLSEIPEPTFYELTEDLIRTATKAQGDRIREEVNQAILNAANRHQTPGGGRGTHTDNNSGGGGSNGGGGGSGGGSSDKGGGRGRKTNPAQATNQGGKHKRKWKTARACPHCGENPCEHEFRLCPVLLARKRAKTDGNTATGQAQANHHVAKLTITEGKKVEELPDQ